MPVASELRQKTLNVLKPASNGVKVLESNDKKKEILAKKKKIITEMSARDNSSLDSTCSSECCSGDGGVVKVSVTPKRRLKASGKAESVALPGPVKRCDWITTNSDQVYTSFHDEEWGVPVFDDKKLFELLTLSIALAEFTWPTILNMRHEFRKVFDNFDPSRIAMLREKDMYGVVSSGRTLLSEPKLRAVVENAKQVLKIQQEFGSFGNYLWRFVNNKPIRNGFQYGRQIPVKTPKAKLISKDLMKRGFRCVGPSVVYSFMQVSGLVNDHLVSCFRYHECSDNIIDDLKPKKDDTDVPINAVGMEGT